MTIRVPPRDRGYLRLRLLLPVAIGIAAAFPGIAAGQDAGGSGENTPPSLEASATASTEVTPAVEEASTGAAGTVADESGQVAAPQESAADPDGVSTGEEPVVGVESGIATTEDGAVDPAPAETEVGVEIMPAEETVPPVETVDPTVPVEPGAEPTPDGAPPPLPGEADPVLYPVAPIPDAVPPDTEAFPHDAAVEPVEPPAVSEPDSAQPVNSPSEVPPAPAAPPQTEPEPLSDPGPRADPLPAIANPPVETSAGGDELIPAPTVDVVAVAVPQAEPEPQPIPVPEPQPIPVSDATTPVAAPVQSSPSEPRSVVLEPADGTAPVAPLEAPGKESPIEIVYEEPVTPPVVEELPLSGAEPVLFPTSRPPEPATGETPQLEIVIERSTAPVSASPGASASPSPGSSGSSVSVGVAALAAAFALLFFGAGARIGLASTTLRSAFLLSLPERPG